MALVMMASPAGVAAQAAQDPEPQRWTELIQLQAQLDGDLRWRRPDGPGAGATSDLFLSSLQIAGTGTVHEGLLAQFVFEMDSIGLPAVATPTVALSEGHLNLGSPGESAYLVLGLRGQPFGQFASHLVTDPITQRGYELDATGVTAGLSGPFELDLSVTLYKGTAHLDGLFASDLLDSSAVRRVASAPRQISSAVVGANVSPIARRLLLFGALVSEPGADRRNLSLNGGFSLALDRPGLVLDVEAVRALRRERYLGATRAYLDGAVSASVSWVFVYRRHRARGRQTFAGRRANLRGHPVVASLRYGAFRDDGLTAALGARTLRDQWSLGGRYTWTSAGEAALYSMVELARLRFRAPPLGGGPSGEWIGYVRVGLSF